MSVDCGGGGGGQGVMRSKSGGGVIECVGVFTEDLLAWVCLSCWMVKVRS